MEKFLIIFLMLLASATCYGWSTNDYTTEDKAKVDLLTLTGGTAGDVLTLQEDGSWIPVTPTGGTGTGDGTGTDDQTAAEVSATTTSFGGVLTNDADSNTVQKCLDKIDDHTHTDTISHERGGLETDVSAYSGVLKITGGSTSQIKYEFGTSATPDADDDVDGGWSIGSKWYETDADVEWTCLDATDGAADWSSGGGSSDVFLVKIIAMPDLLQLEVDDWPLWTIEDEEYASGITITDIGIKTPTSSSYTISLLEYTSPNDGSPSTIESGIATSSSYEAEDDGTLADASIAAGSIIYVDLDTDDVSWVMIWIKGVKN